ncbi:hypothetical protein COCSUDRAFT_33647 [Coccomyxa subellipsoidea C-169]|uniref:Uncharacterized protein n=1 Tax=Coccomyxa subellipsoidea (strain C-169) TaxID=574566 RepID=I0YSI5_COCSC|nr:hypothetical protein COCSUDRAFT_33647 [Coccomyxa subellipsoidea C-169]EIE21354.1 hypothetical protein COCSUDRAFT_33647 [Coccomyxa subellipsoidea C-169]|eukprot:XP_005645898.1 hypothetical protein COCSUDRAFT_33647 [Coccomyxa subellipsoidea C-169]
MRCEEAKRSYTSNSLGSVRRPLLSQLPAALRLALSRQSSLLLFNWDGDEDR